MGSAPNFLGQPRDEATVIDGLRDPSGMVSNRVKFDARDTLVLIEPQSSPFTTLTRAMRGTRVVGQYRYDVFEKDPLPHIVKVNGAQTSGDTTIEVDDGTKVKKWQLLLNKRTGEVFRVTSISTNDLTVVRQYGGTGPAAMNDGDELVIMGEAREDGVGIGSYISTQERDVFNYTQIHGRGIAWSGRQMNTDMYGGRDPNTERKAQAIIFKQDIEMSAFMGVRDSKTGPNSRLITTSGGLKYFATKNVWNLGGNEPTRQQLMEWVEWMMREGDGGSTYGKGVKWLFCSDRMVTIFEKLAIDAVRYVDPLKGSRTGVGDNARKLNVGLRVGMFTTSHGTIMLVKSPIFRKIGPDKSVLVDMEHVRQVTHRGRDMRLLKNQEANDEDLTAEQWFADIGWEITNADAHGWIVNAPYSGS